MEVFSFHARLDDTQVVLRSTSMKVVVVASPILTLSTFLCMVVLPLALVFRSHVRVERGGRRKDGGCDWYVVVLQMREKVIEKKRLCPPHSNHSTHKHKHQKTHKKIKKRRRRGKSSRKSKRNRKHKSKRKCKRR